MMSVKALSLVVLNVIFAWILRMIRYLPSVVTCIAGLASISGFTYRASLLKIHINGNHNVPVCNAEVSQRTLVPLYGHGQATEPSEEEVPSNGMVIPQRPPSLRAGSRTLIATTDSHPSQQLQTHQSNSTSYVALPMFRVGGTTTNVLHPMIGEATYARVSGNLSPMLYTYPNSYHLAGSSSLRMRRQQLHADDKSVRRVYIFLFCCVVICLILL